MLQVSNDIVLPYSNHYFIYHISFFTVHGSARNLLETALWMGWLYPPVVFLGALAYGRYEPRQGTRDSACYSIAKYCCITL